MLFRTIFNRKRNEEEKELIVRKTRYILFIYFVMGIVVCALFGIIILWLLRLESSTQQLWSFWYVFIWWSISALLIGILVASGTVVMKSIAYFYSLVFIEKEKIIETTYSLFFRENVQIGELYRVMSIVSSQVGLLQSVLNYGSIHLYLQNDVTITLSFIPQPKRLVKRIEYFKERIIDERWVWWEEIQE